MFELLVEKLNSFAIKVRGYEVFGPSGGEIEEALVQILKEHGVTQFTCNSNSFDGGPGYECDYFVLSWIYEGNLETIDWLEECF